MTEEDKMERAVARVLGKDEDTLIASFHIPLGGMIYSVSVTTDLGVETLNMNVLTDAANHTELKISI